MGVFVARIAVVFIGVLIGCAETHAVGDGHPGEGGVALPSTRPPRPSVLDLLLVVDNSGSLTEEQWSLRHDLAGLLEALTTGDLDGDGVREAPPFESVQIGVVTTDMGTGGYTVPTCARADFGDDGILRTEGRTDVLGCHERYPSVLAWEPEADFEGFVEDAQCLSIVGTEGCGFEQQLEAALKAVSPSHPTAFTAASYTPPTFFRSTPGHADGSNEGFVRSGSLLAIILVTDEEDCSARDPEVFYRDSPTYTVDLNLRCFEYEEQALHPLDRYVDGLLGLRQHSSLLAFFPVVGVPTDLEPTPGAAVEWDRLTGEPGTRDTRLVERVDPAMPSRLIPSCNVPGRGVAFPPSRILELARRLEGWGARVGVGSICQESFEAPFEAFARLLLE
ncbi:MAG: hypothetical protein KC619_16190 [Myxococcales bacterium]|nr:hypothetical protein [Myxococcales bacterium]